MHSAAEESTDHANAVVGIGPKMTTSLSPYVLGRARFSQTGRGANLRGGLSSGKQPEGSNDSLCACNPFYRGRGRAKSNPSKSQANDWGEMKQINHTKGQNR